MSGPPISQVVRIVFATFAAGLMAAACGGSIPPASDFATLSKSLESAGLSVEPAVKPGPVDSNLFQAPSVLIVASKEGVLAYEFTTASEAAEAASKVSPDGSGIGPKYVNWRSVPNFYRSGRLIVIYDGKQTLINETLTSALGPRFAGGDLGASS